MSKILFVIFLFISLYNNSYSFSDTLKIQNLCNELSVESEIIGLGESTHGTKEFTETRFQIVKKLVSEYNYRTFILEADYYPCLFINEYIQTGQDEPKSFLKNVKLWPWINQEFLNMLFWFREYNSNHPNDPISFYGMDCQISNRFDLTDSIKNFNKIEIEKLNAILNSKQKPKKIISNLYELVEQSENLMFKYFVLNKVDSICTSTNYHDINARDKNMFIMLQSIIQNSSKSKSIIWAHNGHIIKKTPKYSYYIPLGKHVSDSYQSKYKAIGFDFCSGSFMAIDLDSTNFTRPKEFEIVLPTGHWSNSGFITEEIISCDTLGKGFVINNIGAGYLTNPIHKMRFYNTLSNNCEFDFLVLIRASTPITIF